MDKEFRYHPIIENLKINEDGSVILLNGHELKQYETKSSSKLVIIKSSNVSVLKLLCEAWHGRADSPEYIAVRKDPKKGTHYTNIKWSKRGQGVSVKRSKGWQKKPYKFPTAKDFFEFDEARPKDMTITEYLKQNEVSRFAYYKARKRYAKES